MVYEFGRDRVAENRRLKAVEELLDRPSQAILREVGVGPGWHCWDVGAGTGSVARWLGERVGDAGAVLATDLDIAALQEERHAGVSVARHDLRQDPAPGRFDLVHVRLVVEHCGEPRHALARLVEAVTDGGWLVVTDAADLAFAILGEPGHALERLRAPWERAAQAVGWDPTVGGRLPLLLSQLGLTRMCARTWRDTAPGGPSWDVARAGLARLRPQMLDLGATAADIDEALHDLANGSKLVTGGAITSAWAQHPAGG